MTSKDIDTTTKEGKLLFAALLVLKAEGPPELQGKTSKEILFALDKLYKRTNP